MMQKHVRAFLGLCSYYRRFVKGFVDIAKLLYKQTEKGSQFVWNEACESAFKLLKTKLTLIDTRVGLPHQ